MSSTPSEEMIRSEKERFERDIARAQAKIAETLKKLESLPTQGGPSSSKEPSTEPTNLDNVNVFYYASAGNKIFLGTVDDGTKFAHFSLIARDQLLAANARSSKTANKGKQREVTIGRVDREAALLVLKYINNSDIHHPEPITYNLLPTDSTFALRCQVHHACNVFRIPGQLRGDHFRDRLCFEIRQLPTVTCADFQLICETAYFDAGLMNIMQNKVAYHTLRGWITEHELACIWEFVSNHDAEKGSNYVERINAVFEKLQAEATARGQVFQSGWCAEGVTPGQPRAAAPSSVVMPTRPRNMAVGATEKGPIISAEVAAQDQRAHGRFAQANEPMDEETTFIRHSTAGPPLDLSKAPRSSPNKLSGSARAISASISKTILKPSNAALSAGVDNIDWTAAETTQPTQPIGNLGGLVSAIQATPGSSKGKEKLDIAASETKKEGDDKDSKDGKKDDGESKEEHGKDKGKGKGKETTPSAGSPGKMSYAQMLGRGS